jgi:Mrp family chromosome partitioning ATPase
MSAQPADAQRRTRHAPAPPRPGPLAPPMDLAELIADPETRIVVCCGAGGVGKTTTSAALALAAAEAGRSVVVLTIDPARRLAQSLGLVELDNEPRRVEVPGVPGELHAMMLDMKRTFDDIVAAHSTPEKAQQIYENPFYQALSSSFAGTQEYMAMEKLGQLRASEQWDLIIVDTPPSRSALDFLDAPNRMSRFLDGAMIRMLTAPATTALSATRAEGAAEEVVEAGAAGADLAAAALRVHGERMVQAAREQHLADRFTLAHPEVAVRTVPAAAGDVHDLDGLRVMGEALTGPDADTPTGTPRTRVLPARRG